MWNHYRKTLVAIQATIAVVCLALLFVLKMPLIMVLAFFLTMEVSSVIGALWATRLKRKIQAEQERLPLQ